MTMTMDVEIKDRDLNIYVDGQCVLHIGQVSDDDVVNLFFYPIEGDIMESVIHQEEPNDKCTHELIVPRK